MAAAALAAAAAAEIAGCYLVYAVWRLGWSWPWLAAAAILLGLFAALLALVDTGGAGRTFAVYGGVYVAASLVWLRLVEGTDLQTSDLIGGAVVLAGAGLIYLGRTG